MSIGRVLGIGCGGLLVLFLALVVIGAMIGGSSGTNSSGSSSPASSATPAIEVQSVALVAAYMANEVSADAKYKGRIVEVRGPVESIGKDLLDTPYITLEGASFRSVQAFFTKAQEPLLSDLQKGDDVMVRCQCDGVFGNVLLRRCLIFPR